MITQCIVCNTKMSFYFSKFFEFRSLGQVDYWKCPACGFVISKTHAELSRTAWEELNYEYHKAYFEKEFNSDDPRWISRLHAQANIINDLVQLEILPEHRWLDFAGGDGRLAAILEENYKLTLLNFDPYAPVKNNSITKADLTPGEFDFVISTSVFEHMLKREEYDYVASLVSNNGIMGLHTLICENIPDDPEWFYLLPVHCAFFTNKSMSLLLEQWGYKSSIYNVDARLWLFFKTNSQEIKAKIDSANKRGVSKPQYIFKNGFVDYWK